MSGQRRGLENIVRKKSAPSAIVSAVVVLALVSNKNRLSAVFVNAHATVTCYLGRDNTVTAANGIAVAPGGSFTDTYSTDDWYVIPASGSTDLRVLEVT